MEQVRARVVAHRVGAPLRRRRRRRRVSPTRSRPWSVPRWTMSPPTRPLGVLDRRTATDPPPASRQLAAVADLAAALGVERRPVEDDLGRAPARPQLSSPPRAPYSMPSRTIATTVAVGASSSRSRGTRCRRRGAWIAWYSAVELGVPGQLGLLARRGSARAARRGPPRSPRRSTRDAVLGRQLDRQVDREAERVVEPERDVAGQDRRVGRQVLGPPADDPLGRRRAG